MNNGGGSSGNAEGYQAAADATKNKAKRISRESGNILRDYRISAEQTLSRSTANLSRAGLLGWDMQDVLRTNTDLGKKKTQETKQETSKIQDLKDDISELNKEYEELQDKFNRHDEGEIVFDDAAERETARARMENIKDEHIPEIEQQIADTEEKIEDAWGKIKDTEEVELSDAVRHAAGTSHLKISKARDKLEKKRRSYMRQVQDSIYQIYDDVETYETQAEAAMKAQEELENQQMIQGVVSTLLGGGIATLGVATGNPTMVASGASTAVGGWF